MEALRHRSARCVAKMGFHLISKGLRRSAFIVFWVQLSAAIVVTSPLRAQDGPEAPPPSPVPRGAVEGGPPGKTITPPLRRPLEPSEPASIFDAPISEGPTIPPPDSATAKSPEDKAAAPSAASAAKTPDDKAGEPPPDTVSTPPAEDRGVKRAALLRQLENGDVVALDPDPDHPPTVTEPLSMAEAVSFALANNYGGKAAKAKTEATRWELLGGIGQYAPRIDYEYRTGKQDISPASYHYNTGANTYATVPQSRHPTWTSTVTIRQPLADLGIISDILSRSYSLDAAAADELGTREKLALDTISSFFRLIQSRLSIGFANTYKSALDQLGQRMRDRVSGGGASGVELDRITGRSVSARSAEIEARAEYQAASVEFRRLTGVSPIKLALPASLIPAIPDTVEQVLVKSLRGNPDYLAAQLRTDAALASTGKAFSGLLPKVTLEMGHSTTWNSGGIAREVPAATTPSDVFPKTTNKYIATVFTWSLNGGVDLGQGMANAAYARQASATATDTRMRLEESVRIGFNALNAANGRVEALGQAVQANAKVVTSFEEQYATGSRQLLDVLDAYERLYQSQTELARLLVSEATAGFLVRRQMGELVDAIMTRDKD